MRKFFHIWPIKSIEIWNCKKLWVFFEFWHHGNDHAVFVIWLLFWTIWIHLNMRVTTIKIHENLWYSNWRVEYKQRSFGLMLTPDRIELGFGKPWSYIDWETKIHLSYSRILTYIFWKEKYWDDEEETQTFKWSIILPSYTDSAKTIEKKYTYKHITRNRKRWLFPTKTRKTTSINCDPIEHPGKWTTSYNCGDDATYWWSVPWHLDNAKIHKLIAWDCYYDRARYPI